jgi:hypothetical protein
MKKNTIKNVALVFGATLALSGCGSDSSNDNTQADPLELESDGKTLIFYSASTNEQYAFDVDSEETLDLQGSADKHGNDITNFNMNASDKGKLVLWVDNKGDTNASNDEGKVLMFKQSYSFANDGNASWEDFYYLGHFHSHTENDVMSYALAAHSNNEFNVTSGGKYNAMLRLNTYLAQQNQLEQNLSATIPSEANGLCGFHTFVSEDDETFYYAMGKNGTMYIYDNTMSAPALDSVVVTDSCAPNEFGMSSTEDGVLFFSAHTQKVYSVDSHDDGVYHVHSSWDLSQLIGDGKNAQMMLGLEPLK